MQDAIRSHCPWHAQGVLPRCVHDIYGGGGGGGVVVGTHPWISELNLNFHLLLHSILDSIHYTATTLDGNVDTT